MSDPKASFGGFLGIHSLVQHEATLDQICAVQPSLNMCSDLSNIKSTHPVVSMVKGVTYALVNLTTRADLFANLIPGESPRLNLDEWVPSFTGIMFYRLLDNHMDGNGTMLWELRVRMIAINLEDPACGSGGCSLSASLALSKGQKSPDYRYIIEQGEEMGRSSRIFVHIGLDEYRSRVREVKLAGQAALVGEGFIYVH